MLKKIGFYKNQNVQGFKHVEEEKEQIGWRL